jgi:hypothetical protein
MFMLSLDARYGDHFQAQWFEIIKHLFLKPHFQKSDRRILFIAIQLVYPPSFVKFDRADLEMHLGKVTAFVKSAFSFQAHCPP